MNISRRQILGTIGALGITSFGLYSLPHRNQSQKGRILGGGMGLQQGQEVFFLSIVDLDSTKPTPRFIAMDFLGHGLSFHPQKADIISVFEKKGPGSCELNISNGVIRSIATDPSRYFYGHGAYLKNENKLLSTESVLETGEGLIIIRDADTLQIEGQFPSYGARPHDCKLIEGGTVLAITNGGAAFGKTPLPSVTYIEIASQKLLEKYEIENPKFNAGHLAISHNLDLAVASAPRLGLPETDSGSISLLSGDGKLIAIKEPSDIVSQLKSETLSLCIDNSREILAATSPAGNFVSFWKVSNGEYLSSVQLPNPRGIVLSANQEHFLVSYAKEANLASISAKTLKLEDKQSILRAGFSGSHLYSLR